MNYSDFDKRMKSYESNYQTKTIPRLPVIIRVDGKSFHSFTKGLQAFDGHVSRSMRLVTKRVAKEINSLISYTQSDETSFLIYANPYNLNSNIYFDGKIQKLASVVSSMFTGYFNYLYGGEKLAFFDARVFCLPTLTEAYNYFLWREKDALRNSKQMLARSLFSHKECNNKSCSELQQMCLQKGYDWNHLEVCNKKGVMTDYKDRVISAEELGCLEFQKCIIQKYER